MKCIPKYDAIQFDLSQQSIDDITALVGDVVVNEDDTLSFLSGSCIVVVNNTDWVVKYPMSACYVFNNSDFNDKFESA